MDLQRGKGTTGDIVNRDSYATMDFEKAKKFEPWVIFPKRGISL